MTPLNNIKTPSPLLKKYILLSLPFIVVIISILSILGPRLFQSFLSNVIQSLLFLILDCIGLLLGIIGLQYNKKVEFSRTAKVIGLIGTFLNSIILVIYVLSFYNNGFPIVTGFINSIYKDSANNFGYEYSLEVKIDLPSKGYIENNMDLQNPILIVNTTNETAIFEKNRKPFLAKKTRQSQRASNGTTYSSEMGRFNLDYRPSTN